MAVTLMADNLTGLMHINERGIKGITPTVKRILLTTNYEVQLLLQYRCQAVYTWHKVLIMTQNMNTSPIVH